MIDPGLRNRVALVTGANTGIGAQVARSLAALGARVVIHYPGDTAPPAGIGITIHHEWRGRDEAEAIVAEIRATGGEAVAVPADLMDPETIAPLFDAAEELGPVSILVNNAAHCETPDDFINASPGGIDRHFAVNARAPALLIREFATRHRTDGADWASIINVSTDSARVFPTQIGYGASKAALEALTRSAAVELGPWGITVNAIAPGPVQTGWITPEIEESVVPAIPLRRLGTPEDIADAVVFLASRQARWITGQVIQIAGGHAL